MPIMADTKLRNLCFQLTATFIFNQEKLTRVQYVVNIKVKSDDTYK